MFLPYTHDYLTWARLVGDALVQHPDVINLYSSAVSEPTDMLREDLARADLLGTPPAFAWGDPRLTAALTRCYDLPARDSLLLTTGCSMGYLLAVRALVKNDEHVLIETPYYQPFAAVLATLGIRHDFFKREWIADLGEAIRRNTRLMVVSNLHNPTGEALSPDALMTLGALAHRHRLYVLVDQIFGDFADLPSAALTNERFVTLNSLSKVYGLSVLRVGWMIAAEPIMEKLRVIHTLYDNSATRLTQAAALPVVERLEDYRQRALALTDGNRPHVQAFAAAMQAEGLVEGDVPPDGCLYFPHLLDIEDTEGFVRFAAEQHRVLVVPGGFFGVRSHVRLGFGGAPEQVSEGLGRLMDALRAYRRG